MMQKPRHIPISKENEVWHRTRNCKVAVPMSSGHGDELHRRVPERYGDSASRRRPRTGRGRGRDEAGSGGNGSTKP
jgi:hypothetical protein